MATEQSVKRVDMTILCVIIKSGDGTQCEFIVIFEEFDMFIHCEFIHSTHGTCTCKLKFFTLRCFAFLLGANIIIDRKNEWFAPIF